MSILDEKLVEKLKEIARRPLHKDLKINKEHDEDSQVYMLGLDDGETILARYILHSVRIYYSEKETNVRPKPIK